MAGTTKPKGTKARTKKTKLVKARGDVRVAAKPRAKADPSPPGDEAVGSPTLPFPVVGIGASAGGFEAILELVRNLPAKPGVALVVLQHLDPTHESQLTPQIQRSTTIQVVEITDGMRVEKDRIYVMPEHSDVTLNGGVLRLASRAGAHGHRYVIDRFLRSLAATQGSKAIGVVLSGTLTDGTQGLREVKAGGGFTFAQSPETAGFRDMPKNAIDAGCVDFVLAPAAIAREILLLPTEPFRSDAPVGAEPELSKQDEEALAEVLRLVRQGTGVDFRQYRRSTVLRRAQRRMTARRVDGLPAYLRYIRDHPGEVKDLHGDLLINVTRFFRDPAAFDYLSEVILPSLVGSDADRDAIRVWTPGCATGDETYSVAMCVSEFLAERRLDLRVQVFGSDINSAAIKTARAGLYPETIADDVSPARLERFFDRVADGYQVKRAIRSMCVFAVHDLTADPPFSTMDVVSCRNVLIYMQPPLQRRVMSVLHYALKPDGYLMLGPAEPVARHDDLFQPASKEHRVFTRLGVHTPLVLRPERNDGIVRDARLPTLASPLAWSDTDIHRETDHLLLTRYGPPALVVNANLDVVEFRGNTAPFLEHAPGAASLNLMKLARKGVNVALRAAVADAMRENRNVWARNLTFHTDTGERVCDIEVVPLRGPSRQDTYYVVSILQRPAKHRPKAAGKKVARRGARMNLEHAVELAGQRERELIATREYLDAIVQDYEGRNTELRSAHEEALSSNEELLAMNEELETVKEELQSANEELATVNDELNSRRLEVEEMRDDLGSLLEAAHVSVFLIGPDLRVKRFTAEAQRRFKLAPTDVGRLIGDINLPFERGPLLAAVHTSLATATSARMTAVAQDGRLFTIDVSPYRSAEDRAAGVAVVILAPEVARALGAAP